MRKMKTEKSACLPIAAMIAAASEAYLPARCPRALQTDHIRHRRYQRLHHAPIRVPSPPRPYAVRYIAWMEDEIVKRHCCSRRRGRNIRARGTPHTSRFRKEVRSGFLRSTTGEGHSVISQGEESHGGWLVGCSCSLPIFRNRGQQRRPPRAPERKLL